MNITILSFEVPKYYNTLNEDSIEKENKKFSLFKKRKKIKEIEKEEILISYNIEEDRFYYSDSLKSIPTKKDLCRSIIILYDIFKRYQKFKLDDNFKLKTNNLKMFLEHFFDSNNNESELYYQKIIFGSKPINIFVINIICEELGIVDLDFKDYFFFDYPIQYK